MTRRTKAARWLGLVAAAAWAGCSVPDAVETVPTAPPEDAGLVNPVDDVVNPVDDRPAPAVDAGAPADRAAPNDAGAVAELPYRPAPATLQRLTRRQYGNALRDLLGAGLRVPTDLEVDTPLHGFSTVGAAQLTVAPRAAEQYEAAALDVTGQVFGNATQRAALVGCTPAAADDGCARGYLVRMGRRAWRRPLSDAEVTRWLGVSRAVGQSLGDAWQGLRYATAGLLQSPHFLYRVELGAPDPTRPGWVNYDGYEMASRLAFFVWNTTPDDALLDAAAAGQLDTAAGVATQAQRLLASPRARTALGDFFAEYLKLDRLDSLSRDPMAFPLTTPSLAASMRAEVLRIVDDVVFAQDTDVRAMFDTRSTFLNDDLGRLYNLGGTRGAELVRVELPATGPRAGVLTTAGFLALNAHAAVTSPTLRGRFVRQYLLCQEIPPPPPGVVTSIPESSGPTTLRQRLGQHVSDPTCAGCHNLMDPIGFGLEHFDALGVYRTTDNGLPIDATGEVDGVSFRNARGLATALRNHPRVGPCVSRQLFRYATAHKETEAEAAGLRDLATQFQRDGYRLQALVRALVTSDGFRYATR